MEINFVNGNKIISNGKGDRIIGYSPVERDLCAEDLVWLALIKVKNQTENENKSEADIRE